MDQSLKQRLVGAIVLFALAVILLPLIFDGQQEQIDVQAYDIPEKPAFSIQSIDVEPVREEAESVSEAINNVDMAKAEPPAVAEEEFANTSAESHIEQERQADQALQSAPMRSASSQQQAPLTLADAWVIQVGAFSDEKNANALRDKLNKAGYKAYSRNVGELHKVYVGPEIRKYRLEQQKTGLEQEYKVKTLILKYIP